MSNQIISGSITKTKTISGDVSPVVTGDHSKLINRKKADQHPIKAIEGLEDRLQKIEAGEAPIADTELILAKNADKKLYTTLTVNIEEGLTNNKEYNIVLRGIKNEEVSRSKKGISGGVIASHVTIEPQVHPVAIVGPEVNVVDGNDAQTLKAEYIQESKKLRLRSITLNTIPIRPAASGSINTQLVDSEDIENLVSISADDSITVATGSLDTSGAGGTVMTGFEEINGGND